jgi:DNA replication protein DnaC
LLALDHNSKPTQNKIVESISKGIGTGLVEHFEPKGTEKHVKELTINLRMKPTMIFAKMEEEDAAIEAEEGQEVARFKFSWRSKEGIQKSIELLRQEFNKVQGLRQEKIFLMGPPGSGKTHFASKYFST